MDLIRHPDLVEVSVRMHSAFTSALEAEQIAAEVAHRRQRSLRDVLLELEDRQLPVRVTTASRRWPAGRIAGVGKDHLLLALGGAPTLVCIDAIESVEPQ